MSDANDGRPLKRPRHHLRATSPSEDLVVRREYQSGRNHSKSHSTSNRHERRRSREHGRDHRLERFDRKESLTRDEVSESGKRGSPKHRSKSRDHGSHKDSGPRRRPQRSRSRSRSPQSDRYDDRREDGGRGYGRKEGRTSLREGDVEEDQNRGSNSSNRSYNREAVRHGTREGNEDGDRHRDKRETRDRDRRPRSASPKPYARQKGALPSQKDAFSAESNPNMALDKPVEKLKPNFGLTGRLAAASNTVQAANQSIVLKYHEPPEARKPSARDRWRLYIFKDEEILDTVELSEQSCWLFGREVAVADIPIEHSSCSKQHAVIQFRYIEKRNEFGDKIGKVKPYVIDLESANGTTVNEDPIPAAKYVELIDKDVVRFGHSSREYMVQLPPSGVTKN